MCLDRVSSKGLVIISLLLASLMRFFAPACIADDCIRYFGYSIGVFSTPELLPFGIFSFGFWTIKMLQVITPLLFSVGLWMLLKDRMSPGPIQIGILLVNFLPVFNLFWMVLIKNAIMLAILPFFLYYYASNKRIRSVFFALLMCLSHFTSLLFLLPLGFLRKNAVIITMVAVFAVWYLSFQGEVAGASGLTNLNYLLLDIPILTFAVLSKKSEMKKVFLLVAVMSILSLPFLHESWRIFITLNFAALIPALAYLDTKPVVLKFMWLYVLLAFVEFAVYMFSIVPYVS